MEPGHGAGWRYMMPVVQLPQGRFTNQKHHPCWRDCLSGSRKKLYRDMRTSMPNSSSLLLVIHGSRMLSRCLPFILGIFALFGLSSCSMTIPQGETSLSIGQIFTSEYGAVVDAGYQIPAVPINRIDPKYHRQIVTYRTRERPGTIIVDTRNRFLYYILSRNSAVRYGIGVGRAGFGWEGNAYVAWKRPWPTWTPPKEMVQRQPHLARYAENGMSPGLNNPLGARALYLFDDDGNDTLYRLHGTPEWSSIGTAASSGCIRLMNQDIIDLYSRVRPGRSTRVIVRQ